MSFVVAIDGPAAAGKGTISRAVAKEFGFAHLDTGLLYRAVGKRALNMGRGVIDEGVAELVARELSEADVVDEGLRTVLVSRDPAGGAARCWSFSASLPDATGVPCWMGAILALSSAPMPM